MTSKEMLMAIVSKAQILKRVSLRLGNASTDLETVRLAARDIESVASDALSQIDAEMDDQFSQGRDDAEDKIREEGYRDGLEDGYYDGVAAYADEGEA